MSATEPFTTEWWKNLSVDKEFSRAVDKISWVLAYTGKWNKKARVLELQCGLGAMPLFMNDNDYNGFHGADNSENVVDLWEGSNSLHLVEPDHTGFDDNEFDLVCWFSMSDGRIEQDRVTEVLNEMERIGNGVIALKPFDNLSFGNDTEFLAFMLENGWACINAHPKYKMFLFQKG